MLQRRILAALAATTNEPAALTTRELASLLERSPRRIRAAVCRLEDRGLIRVENRSGGYPDGSGLLMWHEERAATWDADELKQIGRETDEDAWEWEDDAWHWSPLP